MKNLYDTIEQNLKVGLQVVVKDLTYQTYCIIFNLKDNDGFYRTSGWFDSIEEAKKYIGNYYGHPKEYWDALNLEIVEVFRPEYKPFKVGDKVELLDSIKKTNDWENVEESFPDMTGKVEGVYFEPIGINYGVNGCWIGHEFLVPLQITKVEEETIKIGDHTYSKSEVEKRLKGLKEI